MFANPPFNPNTVNRTIVDENFHMPVYDSVSLEVQREFTRDVVLRVGYVGTKGTSLFESVDANPTVIGCTQASAANNFCRSIRTRARRVCAPTQACRSITRCKPVWRSD